MAPAEQHGPDFVGATPPDMAAQEASARSALAVVEVKAAAMAEELGYQGALTVGTLEDEIRFYQRRTVEAILETGKRLLLLKEITPHGEFTQRVELLGFSDRTARRFMQAAAKTAKSANLAVLASQVKSSSAFLELVTHDDDVLENLSEMDDIDRLSASQLRERLRQSEQDVKFAAEKRAKAEERADKAEKKLQGKRPVVVPLDERILPFKGEIADRQALLENGIAAHHEATIALEQWWTDEVTQAEGYDPEAPAPLPRSVALVALHLQGSINRLAELVGAAQHAFEERFGDDLAEARQYLMQTPEAADAAA
ncbi:MAG: DUF3102 domain-containing protein [Gammaproteobacteria bacterium]|nr:DUF3102 domain-containing protein [Gammaproteobacteria bacterium]MBU1505807.1 DUF3102 domain-containing protein [Gammaproteobacteria bacterium]MBU2119495.1 DUF3102 domain-containing protein [Gammaproteobacteria bacterium]MBU2172599.1 DUF3102 domain-containing protein [Gammaproteobacteria bacterium]MBU2202057.1 DUF3102 domain-containing protein [Gammaproteobacteria bacterium]